ncbi:MAG: hypothetical protein EHM41_24875 [Chloroflexi bacterium]|nr:MAG: hypothetical protein EHM41_24875 [Chloroflexota bacterium]
MKPIVVLVKQILDPRGITVRRDKERVFINREDYIIDPGSLAAIEAAYQIKNQLNVEIAAVSLGPPRAEDALREALALGCDAAYLLSDPAFEAADAAAAVRIIAAAIQKIGGTNLILLGEKANDSCSGQIGPRLAEALDYPQVTGVSELTVAETTLHAKRTWRNEPVTVSSPLPAVVTVAAGAYPERYPHGARIMSAYREWNVTVWDKYQLALEECDLMPGLVFRGESYPSPLPENEILKGDPASLVHDLVAELRQHRIIH